MRDADRRGLGDAGAPDRDVFKLDRTDPFAARFDHVLRAIGDLHRAVGMQHGDVAGVEPAFIVEAIAAVVTEIALHHPRSSEEHTSEIQSLLRISYDVFCLKNKHLKT